MNPVIKMLAKGLTVKARNSQRQFVSCTGADLFAIPLSSVKEAAEELYKKTREDGDTLFGSKKADPSDVLKLEALKEIVKAREELAEEAKNDAAKAEEASRLRKLLQERKDAEFGQGLSSEDIENKIKELTSK